MRNPLDSITITGAFQEVAQPGTGLPDANGVKRHIGVDLRASVGTKLFAPGAGKVTSSYTSATSGLQVIEALIDSKLHRFLHLSRRDVVGGQTFVEGQVIGLTGNSGGVPAHLHWDVRKNGTTYNASLSNYYNPFSVINSINKGEEMFNTDAEVKEAYLLLRGNEGSAGERAGWIGQSKQAFFRVAKPEADSVRQQLADVKQALLNEQAKPAKEVIKEVVKIVEKPVEVIKTVEVIKEVNPTWLQKTVDFLRGVLGIK